MRIKITLFISFLLFGELKSQTYHFDCVTSQIELPFNSVYDSITQFDSITGSRYIYSLSTRLTDKEKKDLLQVERFPVNSHRLFFSPNLDFTAFSIQAYTRNSYFNYTNPYANNRAFVLNENTEMGYYNINDINSVVSLRPVFSILLQDLVSKLDSAYKNKIYTIIKHQFKNQITNYTEFIKNEKKPDLLYSLNSTYFEYDLHPELRMFKMHFEKIVNNWHIKHYSSPFVDSRILNKYERTHDVDTAYFDGFQDLITSGRTQIGFKLVTSFEEFDPQNEKNKSLIKGMDIYSGSTLGIKNDITYIGLVFKNEFKVSETIWLKVSEIKKYESQIGFEIQLEELKFLLKSQIEQKSKVNY